MFFYDDSRIGGIALCLCLFILGIPKLKDELYEYRQAVNENDTRKANSRLLRMSRSAGLIIAGILVMVFLVFNWANLD
jgi:uncharacterized membrane protein